MSKRLTQSEAVEAIRNKRLRYIRATEAISEDGWEFFDPTVDSLEFVRNGAGGLYSNRLQPSLPHFAVPNMSRLSTPADIFMGIVSPKFIYDTMEIRRHENPEHFIRYKGGGRTTNVCLSEESVYHYFAVRAWIQGGNVDLDLLPTPPRRPLDGAFAAAHIALSEHARNVGLFSFPSVARLKTIHSLIYLKIGSPDEQRLCARFQQAFRYYGEVIAADEKLYHYTGKSGMVRLCPNKPARIGLWHYQAAVYLECGLPVVIYTRCHCASSKMGEKVPTVEIVEDWANLVLDREEDSVLVFDSYYLSKDGRRLLNEIGVKYVCALKPDRFRVIKNLLSAKVTESGMWAAIYNKDRQETAVFHWSMDKHIGKKLCFSNAYKLKTGKRTKKGTVPAYDYYNAGFAGCDRYNQRMYNRGWRHPIRRTKMGTDIVAGWNYLYTTILLNCWHLWIGLKPEERMDATFKSFTAELARGLVKEMKPADENDYPMMAPMPPGE